MSFIRNINAWKAKTESAKARVKSSATGYVRKQALMVLKEAVRVSPQWSGDYAFNWVLEVTGQEGSYDRRYKREDWRAVVPKQAGDPAVVADAVRFAQDVLPFIKWNSKIRLVNYSPTAKLIESGQVNLRPENLIYAPHGVTAYLNTKYKYLGKL